MTPGQKPREGLENLIWKHFPSRKQDKCCHILALVPFNRPANVFVFLWSFSCIIDYGEKCFSLSVFEVTALDCLGRGGKKNQSPFWCFGLNFFMLLTRNLFFLLFLHQRFYSCTLSFLQRFNCVGRCLALTCSWSSCNSRTKSTLSEGCNADWESRYSRTLFILHLIRLGVTHIYLPDVPPPFLCLLSSVATVAFSRCFGDTCHDGEASRSAEWSRHFMRSSCCISHPVCGRLLLYFSPWSQTLEYG